MSLWNLSTRDFFMLIGFGQISGYNRVAALGNNPDVDTGSQEDIWTGGGIYPWMTSATQLEAVSTSASDSAAGVGARSLLVNGLSDDYDPAPQSIALDGTTAVPIPTAIFRINGGLIMSAGSSGTNVGDIIIRDLGGGTTRAIIPAGYGITRQSQYTVRAGHTLSVVSLLMCINRPTSTRDATVATFIQSPNGFYRLPLEVSVDGNPYRHDGNPGIIIPEKTDFGLRCTYVSTSNTDLQGAWLGILKDNEVD